MKKSIFIISLVLAAAFVLGAATVQSQTGRGGYGYGMGPGMVGDNWIDIPDKLPTPKNIEWIQKLKEILALEKESLAQYEADQEKFNAYMPYMMVIPQEENHVTWIEQLFKAYGLHENVKVPSIVDNKTLTEAYEHSVKLENDLLPRYEWLVKKAEDNDTAEAMNIIFVQSRWHLVMFDHALRMGHGYGFSRGWRMGHGMMGGYGAGYSMGSGMMSGYYGYDARRGYRWQHPPSGKGIDVKEVEAMMNDYLKSSRNPNLKLGKIKDMGSFFEVDILTKKNDLADLIHIDKATGYIKSAY